MLLIPIAPYCSYTEDHRFFENLKKLSCNQRKKLIRRHQLERNRCLADRIKTILRLDVGWSYSRIAEALFLED